MSEKKPERRGLGRGLSALMAEVDISASQPTDGGTSQAQGVETVPIELIHPNPDQPRKSFDMLDLEELAASIREKGILQPLILRNRPGQGGQYEIVAGERRWRAAQMAQVHELPAILREFSDLEVLEIAIIENVQRAGLNPLEEAMGFRQLQDKFGHTQEQLSKALGKSRSHIANLMRLLNLPSDVLDLVRSGDLSAGHARALITAENPSALAKEVVAKGLSVRETEALAKAGLKREKSTKSALKPQKDADTRQIEQDLSASLGMRVEIEHASSGEKGKVLVHYKDFSDLDRLCRILSGTS